MNQKEFVNILVVVGIIIVVGVIGYFVVNKRVSPPTPAPTTTSSPTPVSETKPSTQLTQTPEKGITTLYDRNVWTLIKSVEGNYGGDAVKILLLKSVQETGESGTGDPLYDVGLLIIKNNKVVYNYISQGVKPSKYPGVNTTKFYMDDALDMRDVTNDGMSEIIFHSGFMGASDWTTLEHILQYHSDNSFSDIMAEEFYGSLNHGIAWVDNVPVVIKSIGDGACHTCPRPFQYNIYTWSQNTFVLSKTVEGKKSYGGASAALQNDLGIIRNAIKN